MNSGTMCTNCGQSSAITARFCSHCGSPLSEQEASTENKDGGIEHVTRDAIDAAFAQFSKERKEDNAGASGRRLQRLLIGIFVAGHVIRILLDFINNGFWVAEIIPLLTSGTVSLITMVKWVFGEVLLILIPILAIARPRRWVFLTGAVWASLLTIRALVGGGGYYLLHLPDYLMCITGYLIGKEAVSPLVQRLLGSPGRLLTRRLLIGVFVASHVMALLWFKSGAPLASEVVNLPILALIILIPILSVVRPRAWVFLTGAVRATVVFIWNTYIAGLEPNPVVVASLFMCMTGYVLFFTLSREGRTAVRDSGK